MSSPSPYFPLPSRRSFRLLKLTACPEDPNSNDLQLQCSLDIFDLGNECPEYVALSYTWGPPFDDESTKAKYAEDCALFVSHNQQPLCEQRIGRNLFDALIQIHKTKWQSYIWADAICINQADIDERASQVKLMGDIYSQPKFVIAWIGPEPTGINDVLWWFDSFIKYLEATDDDEVQGSSLEGMMPRASCRRDPDSGENVLVLQGSDMTVSKGRVLELHRFFTKTRYWSRTWVLQELALPREICFLLGQHELQRLQSADINSVDVPSILWLWFVANIEIIRTLVDDTIEMSPPITYTIGSIRHEMFLGDDLDNPFRTQRSQWFNASSDESHALASMELLLARNSHLSSTDPRDKIYGLLGIISRCMRTSADMFEVTYKITTEELLRAITIRLISDLPHMTCFALRLPSCYRQLNLPSWVIEPTTPSRTFQPGGLSTYRRTPYNACPTRDSANSAVEFQGNELRLFGHHCGTIRWLVSGFSEDVAAPGFVYDRDRMLLRSANSIRCYLKLIKEMGPNYRWIEGQPIWKALIETMTLSRDAEELLATHINAEALWIMTKRYMWRLVELGRTSNGIMAETARTYLKDCTELVVALAESGVAVSESLVAYTRQLLIEEVDLNAFETAAAFNAETTTVLPLLQNSMMVHRMLFGTEQNFIGLVPDDAQVGDQLWVLCRARVPQVLRPLADGNFVSLGETYVHGGVDGELFEKGIAGPLRQVKIV